MHPATSDKPTCRFCGSAELHETIGPVLRSGALCSVFFCDQCSIGMTWPQPDAATLVRLYAPGEYRADRGKRFIAPIEFLFELHKKWLIWRINSSMKSGRMLDVGCGSGFLASLFAGAGWDVTGVERDDDTAIHARETYRIAVVTDIDHARGPFDLIMVNHVLEHLDDPLRMLEKCRELLAPGGRLIIAVPNFSSLQAKVGGAGWFHLDMPFHLYHFSEQGLVGLLHKAGFSVVESSHADWIQNIYGWLQSLLNRAGISYNALYDLLRMRGRGISASAWSSLLCCLWAVPLALLGICVERVCRTGGVIRCTAVVADRDSKVQL
ncbi:MAG TPA: hypothetical protein DER40_14055 [Geobacter sp.]|nr:hypothetical protein [Geobacter sp.]